MSRLLGVAILIAAATAFGQDATALTPAFKTDGISVHQIESAFQEGQTEIRVLPPDGMRSNERYKAVYVLPVEARRESRYGDGLTEVQRNDLHNKHQLIFIAPTFSHLPWYADHPSDSRIRQESYFLQVVLPLVEKHYPVIAAPEGRLLLGFSKSGWGAGSLLLRHPDLFGRAAAWDAPMMMDQLGKYGTTPIFATQANFERYRITDLLRTRGESLGPASRLILTGYGNFRGDHELVHALMDELRIPHTYKDGPERKHDWHSGWLSEAVELLVNQ